jgi:hypothetical protein
MLCAARTHAVKKRQKATTSLFQRPWRMIAASERPARAAAVANPARSECPAHKSQRS